MIDTRLPVLGAVVAMLVTCGVAVARPNQPSASYFMPGCRDAASLINFSVRESEEEVVRMNFCAGIVLGLSFMGELHGICVPPDTRLPSKPPVLSFSTSTDSLRGLTRTSALLPLRLCEQTGRVIQAIQSLRDPSPGNTSVVRGHNGQALAYVCFDDEPGRR